MRHLDCGECLHSGGSLTSSTTLPWGPTAASAPLLVQLLEGRALGGAEGKVGAHTPRARLPWPWAPLHLPAPSRAVGPLEPQGFRVSAAGTRAQQLGVSGPQSGLGDGGWWQQLTHPLGPEPPCLGSKEPRSPWRRAPGLASMWRRSVALLGLRARPPPRGLCAGGTGPVCLWLPFVFQNK